MANPILGFVRNVPRASILKCQVRTMRFGMVGKPFNYKEEIPMEKMKTLNQQLEELNVEDPTLTFKVDIGFPVIKNSRSEVLNKRIEILQNKRNDPNLEKLAREHNLTISEDKVKEEWLKSGGLYAIKTIAEHYSVYQDLFGDAYFIPNTLLNISFDQGNGNKCPIHRGNVVKPCEAKSAPEINFSSDPDSMWTLLLTNPDGHFTDQEAEYVHWFVGNIPGNNISKGECIVDYLQPFPPKGTGFHRMIFVLYKQEKKMDFSHFRRKSPCLRLEDRTFRTLDFYRERQDDMTPAGLAFFQTDWDPSLTDFFHKTLEMREPCFEYDFPPPYIRPQERFPIRRSFNEYMDKYRDPKQIAKEYLLQKFKKTHPFKKPEKEFQYPAIHVPLKRTALPSWLRTKMMKDALRWGRINDF